MSRGSETKLIFIRHPTTLWTGTGRFVGQLNPPLDDSGRETARAMASSLATIRIAGIVTSDLKRAEETGSLVAEATGAICNSDTRLREEHLGWWQGKTREAVKRENPDAYQVWRMGILEPISGREGLQNVADRVCEAIEHHMELRSEPLACGPLIVISHVNAIIAAIGSLLSLHSSAWLSIGSLNYGRAALLSRDRIRWQLRSHNLPIPTLVREARFSDLFHSAGSFHEHSDS